MLRDQGVRAVFRVFWGGILLFGANSVYAQTDTISVSTAASDAVPGTEITFSGSFRATTLADAVTNAQYRIFRCNTDRNVTPYINLTGATRSGFGDTANCSVITTAGMNGFGTGKSRTLPSGNDAPKYTLVAADFGKHLYFAVSTSNIFSVAPVYSPPALPPITLGAPGDSTDAGTNVTVNIYDRNGLSTINSDFNLYWCTNSGVPTNAIISARVECQSLTNGVAPAEGNWSSSAMPIKVRIPPEYIGRYLVLEYFKSNASRYTSGYGPITFPATGGDLQLTSNSPALEIGSNLLLTASLSGLPSGEYNVAFWRCPGTTTNLPTDSEHAVDTTICSSIGLNKPISNGGMRSGSGNEVQAGEVVFAQAGGRRGSPDRLISNRLGPFHAPLTLPAPDPAALAFTVGQTKTIELPAATGGSGDKTYQITLSAALPTGLAVERRRDGATPSATSVNINAGRTNFNTGASSDTLGLNITGNPETATTTDITGTYSVLADGNETDSQSFTLSVAAAPPPPPANPQPQSIEIVGEPMVGETLTATATLSGSSSDNFTIEFLRCDTATFDSNCANLPNDVTAAATGTSVENTYVIPDSSEVIGKHIFALIINPVDLTMSRRSPTGIGPIRDTATPSLRIDESERQTQTIDRGAEIIPIALTAMRFSDENAIVYTLVADGSESGSANLHGLSVGGNGTTTATVRGTPTQNGVIRFVVRATSGEETDDSEPIAITVNPTQTQSPAPAPAASGGGGSGAIVALVVAGGAYYWWKKRQIANGNAAKMALLPDVNFDLDRNDNRAFYTKMNWQNPSHSNWQLRGNAKIHTKYSGKLLDWHANSHLGYRLNGKFGEINPYLRGKFVANDPENAKMDETYTVGVNYAIPNRFSAQFLQPDDEIWRYSLKTEVHLPRKIVLRFNQPNSDIWRYSANLNWQISERIGLNLSQPDNDLPNYGFGVQWRNKSKIRYGISGETGGNSYRFTGSYAF